MALNIQVLSDNRLFPTVFNIVQGSNNVDTVVYTLENYIVGERDLSTYDWYVHLIGVTGVDAVKLTSAIVGGKLQITFDLTEYVTRLGNTLTYQLVAKDEVSAVWNSAKGVILNAESINADDKIVAQYPSILRQWELYLKELAGSLDAAVYYIAYNETLPKEQRVPGRLYFKYLYAENNIGQLEDSNGNILIPEPVAKNIGITAINGLTASNVQTALEALKVMIENKDSLPAQSGNDGKYLRTIGGKAEWAEVVALPDQTGKEGKFLKSNGESAEWVDIPRGMPLLSTIWSDHLFNDASYLRADNFSWHSGDVYIAAYGHLVADMENPQKHSAQLYGWEGGYYTTSKTPAVGDIAYLRDDFNQYGGGFYAAGTVWAYTAGNPDNIIVNLYSGIAGVGGNRVESVDTTGEIAEHTDTIGNITITYFLAQDGHKICLPDQESKVMALYEKTGAADYYLLDTENKQFKLPRKNKRKLIQAVKNSDGTWYNLYSDGWVEQGGDVPLNSTNVVLPIEMQDTSYECIIMYTNGNTNNVTFQWLGALTKTIASFTCMSASASYRKWHVTGYAAESAYASAGMNLEYYYVGNYIRNMTEIDVGAITETLNSLTAQISALQAENQAMMGRMDFANAVEVRVDATTTSYTVPSDGYIQFSTTNANSGAIYINDKYFCHITSVSNGNAGLIPVTAGDVLSTNTESGWVYMTFIPQKQ